MGARLDMLAGLALAGLCASPRARTGRDPMIEDEREGIAKHALALAQALDAILPPETSAVDVTPPVPARKR